VSKRENIVDISLLEFCVREELNKVSKRVMAVLDPIKVVLTNYPEGQTEMLETENNPEDPNAGTRELPFSRELWIESGDFMEDAPKKFFRLKPGGLVRLKSAYIIQCDEVVKNDAGEIVELRCTYFPDSKSGQDTSGLRPKATIHWLSVPHAISAEVRLYDRLFQVEDPSADDRDFKELLNPDSLIVKNAWLEPSLAEVAPGEYYQFIRLGYFTPDPDSQPGKPVFNRTATLRDNWAKMKGK
ncbi:MAG: glutamine--tRNA ligase, partial [Bacteroidetes bacterium]